MQRVNLGGVDVDLLSFDDALDGILARAGGKQLATGPLAVVSANLDHIAQFGSEGRWYDTLDDRLGPASNGKKAEAAGPVASTEWLTLLDGAPLVAQAEQLTGRTWPRLAGSDLIGPLLDAAEAEGISVGFLGGSRVVQRLLSRRLTRSRPGLLVAGMWSPDRATLADHEASLELAEAIAASGAQLLIVGLGKPRQELWIAEYGPCTGANVLLAFGAVVDFLAGSMQRAPRWASEHGLEWAWRLALEPRRLARRYLIDDPPGLLTMRKNSVLLDDRSGTPAPAAPGRVPELQGTPDGSFIPHGEDADVVVYVVTYNSAGALDDLVASLRREAKDLRLRVVVADNDSSDGTFDALAAYPDVCAVATGGNLGYACGINAAMRIPGRAGAVLVLNPDLVVEPGAIRALYARMTLADAGIVVPQLFDSEGATYPSLRREPTIARAVGDALFGSRFRNRPGWLSDIDYDAESYRHPHRVQWAMGAALLIRAAAAESLGDWDEQFFLYSEETDYFRRAREMGLSIWYEPSAKMTHHQGGSGSSPQLNALMAVNRIRYVRKHHSRTYAAGFRFTVALTELLRCWKRSNKGVLPTLISEQRWESLPGPTAAERLDRALEHFPSGAVIIPAHNDDAVIRRTLEELRPVVSTGQTEVIVACNGCTDSTADIAREYDGVRVLELERASKVAALNAADAAASLWPRVYLDADIEMSPVALRKVLDRLGRSDVLAARPVFRYDTAGASPLVEAFYRARRRIPSTTRALWGAGVYGLSEEGHARLSDFPNITADDLFVDRLFEPDEKAIVNTPPVAVRTPRNVRGLLQILRRNYRGQAELRHACLGAGRATTLRTLRELLASVRGPASALDALAYAGFVITARVPSRRRQSWERDDSSRR